MAPSARDIGTDFRFANELGEADGWRRVASIWSYVFISLPGVVLFVRKI